MKIIDIVNDLLIYIKERKEHPVLFPIMFIWLFVHWDIIYALLASKYNFEKMVQYVDCGIRNAGKNKFFFTLCIAYFVFIPLMKLISSLYNDALDTVKGNWDKYRETNYLKLVKIKNEAIEEENKHAATKIAEIDIQVYEKIAKEFSERPIIELISDNFREDIKYISISHSGFLELRKFLVAISAPSNVHYNERPRRAQKELIKSISELQSSMFKCHIEEIYDENDGNQESCYEVGNNINQLIIQANVFMEAYRNYVESIRELRVVSRNS